MESTVRESSPSLLLYLFADRFVPEKKFRSVGVEIPCRNVQVKLEELAAGLFAVAFWSLREQGIIGLEAFRARRMLVVPTTRVRVSGLGSAPRPGLEGEILKALGEKKEDHVYALVRRWFGTNSRSPHWDVVRVVIKEAMDLGYMSQKEEETGRGAVTGFFLGKTRVKLDPSCEKISSLEGHLEEFASRWENFQSSETELYGALLEQARKAINSRTESDSDYDFPN